MTYDNSIKKIAELYDARITSTKDAVKLFNEMCLTDSKDPINSWTKFFKEISSVN